MLKGPFVLKFTKSFRVFRSIKTRFLCTSAQEKLICLDNRSLVRLKGPEALEFLQGLITNDINHLNSTKSIYSMFLNVRGRVIGDSFIYKSSSPDTFLVESDAKLIDTIFNHLKKYRVRKKVDIEIAKDLKVFSLLKGNIEKIQKDISELIGKNGVLCMDPRVPDLGLRILGDQDVIKSNFECSYSDLYKIERYKLGIAEGSEEIFPESCFPLEMNCDYMHGVSFHKGCYIGQELTARTHHTGVIRKRIMPIILNESEPEGISYDSIIEDSSKEKPRPVGKLRGLVGQHGIALMRVSEALSSNLMKLQSRTLTCHRPPWWPLQAPKNLRPG